MDSLNHGVPHGDMRIPTFGNLQVVEIILRGGY